MSEFLKTVKGVASHMFKEGGEISPFLAVLGPMGPDGEEFESDKFFILAFDPRLMGMKDVLARFMLDKIEEMKAVEAAFVSEVWMKKGITMEQRAELPKDLAEDHDEEGVMVVHHIGSSTPDHWLARINRKGKEAVIEEYKKRPGAGRFLNPADGSSVN